MRWKKIGKSLLIIVVSLVVVGGLGFGAFVYNPFEGSYPEIRTAVPTNVDFFVSKKNLAEDFSEFPEPAFWESFTAAPWWARLRGTGLFRSLAADAEDPLNQLDDLKQQLGAVPVVGLDILHDLAGKDVAIAGRLRANGVGYDVCAYSRVSWKICAGIGLLGYEFARNQAQGARITEESDGLFRVESGGAEPVWITRIMDLAIAGNSLEFVKESVALATGESTKDDLNASADYNDDLLSQVRDWGERTNQTNVAQTMVDFSMVRRAFPGFVSWPGRSDDTTVEERLVDAFMNQQAMRRLWTSVVFEENPAALSALALLNVNNGQLTGFQRRFHEEAPASKETWLKPVLTWVPETAAMALVLRVPPSAFLGEMTQVLDRDAQDLLQEGLRRSGIRGGVAELIGMIAPALDPWVGVVFRNNDYPRLNEEFKVFVPSPAAAAALILRCSTGAEAQVRKFISLFKDKLRYNLAFNDTGMRLPAGPGEQLWIQEWGNRHIPATGQIALMFEGSKSERYFILSNKGQLLREMVNAHFGLRGKKSLLVDTDAIAAIDEMPEKISGFCWVHGDNSRAILQKYQSFAQRQAQDSTPDPVWAAQNRAPIAKRIFDQHFRGQASSAAKLRGQALQRFDQMVEQKLAEMWQREGPRMSQEAQRVFNDLLGWFEYLQSASLVLRARPKDLRLEARIFPRW